jgi:hypothetical protein
MVGAGKPVGLGEASGSAVGVGVAPGGSVGAGLAAGAGVADPSTGAMNELEIVTRVPVVVPRTVNWPLLTVTLSTGQPTVRRTGAGVGAFDAPGEPPGNGTFTIRTIGLDGR